MFAVLRNFDENASRIFGKFEMFAYEFIDFAAPNLCSANPRPMRRIRHARGRFQLNFAPDWRPRRQFGNRPFTMSTRRNKSIGQLSQFGTACAGASEAALSVHLSTAATIRPRTKGARLRHGRA
jgi:hypothetical protein